ncbi:hypothetical protein J2S21_003358 [Peribacillus cavernae]|nr:hypothetical protein [Peribacillus cavernae]
MRKVEVTPYNEGWISLFEEEAIITALLLSGSCRM